MIKKILCILICFIFIQGCSLASTQKAEIKYDNDMYLPKNTNLKTLLSDADKNMLLYEKAADINSKKLYLERAMRRYYMATKIDPTKIEANIGLARTYDIMQLDRFSKEYFYKAGNINPYNPSFNYHFANFFFSRSEYLNALKYYSAAYQNGLAGNFDLNYKLGTVYEKLADLETAKYHYVKASKIATKNESLDEKIRILDELNYSDSQYYLFTKKK